MKNSAILPAQNLTLIKAGAGAGKTFTIQSTLAEWIKHKQVRADRILAVTFTIDAANEMRTRIRLALLKKELMAEARLLHKSNISTIHAFGLEILKTFAYEAGNSPTPRQLTEHEQDLLMREALDKAQAIRPLLDDLKHFGYKGGYAGDEYREGDDQLTDTILNLTGKLRSLGKGFDTSPNEVKVLLDQAKAFIKNAYGHVEKDGTVLTDNLWRAIEAVKAEYPGRKVLGHKDEWGNNKQTQAFVENIYKVTREALEKDWKLWVSLQYGETLKKIRDKHPRANLAEAVWDAAEKLSVHPGPLNDALQHIDCLINAVIEALAEYQRTKEQAGLVDYGDMVHLANDMLDNHPEWLDEIASGYDCLIIDEFQDTNPLQYALLRRFQASSKYTLIVGDLKQSIMGFQGSDSRLFDTLLKEGEPQDGVVKELKANWRSTPALMDFINDMGEKLYGDRYRRLESSAGYHSDLSAVQALRFSKEHWNKDANSRSPKPGFTAEGNTALANHIADLLSSDALITDRHSKQKRPIQGADIAVLARGHKRLRKFADALRNAGIEVQIQQPGFLSCDAVQWALNVVQALNNECDHYAWLDLLTSPLVDGCNTERLQSLLTGYRKNYCFKDELTEQLSPLGKHLRAQSVKTQLLTIIEKAKLFETIKTQPLSRQYRANLIKLVGLAEEFEAQAPETLNAMGIAGKNASTFRAWLTESKDTIDEQPGADPQAENAVVLKTWHSSKGLEWPVVMVLDAEKASEPRFPNISMAYPDGGIETMLEQSFVQIVPQFDDKATKERFSHLLAGEQTETDKNLYYVTLTRAREQLILPWWDGFSDGSMFTYIESLLNAQAEKNSSTLYQEKSVTPATAELFQREQSKVSRNEITIAANNLPERLKHTISPSLYKGLEGDEVPEIQITHYNSPLNLDLFEAIPANVLGAWVHKLYQVYFMQPRLLDKALARWPGRVTEIEQKQAVISHLESFKNAIEPLATGDHSYECEVQVAGLNDANQIVSGVIDMVVIGASEKLLVDHKSDISTSGDRYWRQVAEYRSLMGTPVHSTVLNWVRQGIFHIKTM
jgi:ATP-dependent helicase/nuclease subunit A